MNLFSIQPTKLYYLGADNKLRVWRISVLNNNTIKISHGHLGGALQDTFEEVTVGKGGRSVYQQIKSRVESRINKQKLKGYKETIKEAKKGRTNVLGFHKPMLAQPWHRVKNIDFLGAWWQFKYDGNRCLITNKDGELIAYSRNGKRITTIDHILEGMELPEGLTIDGELYHHGTPLNILRSWLTVPQEGTKKIKLRVFDCVETMSFKFRWQLLNTLKLGDNAKLVPTFAITEESGFSISAAMAISRGEGYEGIILRLPGIPYEIGKRSKSLIKIKHFEDDEFEVVDIFLSEKNHPMAKCVTKEGKFFDVVLPGTFDDKFFYLSNKEKYIGQKLVIQFSQWTTENLPFHAVAKCWENEKNV